MVATSIQRAHLDTIATVGRVSAHVGGRAWLRGGWAMDFALGYVTREHRDLDMFVEEAALRRVVDVLISMGWVLDGSLPRQQQANLSRDGVDLSLNPVAHDQLARPVVPTGPWKGAPWPETMLTGARVGTLEGVRATYISVAAQVECKEMTPTWTGRPTRPKDQRDVALLRGLTQVDSSAALAPDERTGLPVLSVGRVVTSSEVAAALDDE